MTDAAAIPPPDLRHLIDLTDEVGIFEHANGADPRTDIGYCTDDAGRALALCSQVDAPAADDLCDVYLGFLHRMHLGQGRFALRYSPERKRTELDVSDDACGRALQGLGSAASSADRASTRDAARELFDQAAAFRSPWPRAMAHAGIGAAAILSVDPDNEAAIGLLRSAVAVIGGRTSHGGWLEPRLTYGNALLPECLLAAGDIFNNIGLLRRGVELLRWLIEAETSDAGHFSFTPVGGWAPGEPRPGFDQQPIEAGAMADAAARAFALVGAEEFASSTFRAARWFLGENDAAVPVFDPLTGGGFDGLSEHGTNRNMGAESTIAFIGATQRAADVARISGVRTLSPATPGGR